MKLKQVFPEKLVFDVDGEVVEVASEDILERIKTYVETVGEEPDEEALKKMLRKIAGDIHRKKHVSVRKPDFTKFIGELEVVK